MNEETLYNYVKEIIDCECDYCMKDSNCNNCPYDRARIYVKSKELEEEKSLDQRHINKIIKIIPNLKKLLLSILTFDCANCDYKDCNGCDLHGIKMISEAVFNDNIKNILLMKRG